MQLDKVQ